MFQYGYSPKYERLVTLEDTGLITLREAKALWNKYLPDFIKRLKEGSNPEMALWIDCKTETDYHQDLVWIDETYETDGQKVWKMKRVYIPEF